MDDVRNPDHYAIVIGINRYPQFPPLSGAVRDATRFAEWLVQEDGGGLSPKNMGLLLSPPDPEPVEPFTGKPDHAMVTKALATRIRVEYAIQNKVSIGKRFYFYFSGHGFGPKSREVGMLFPGAAPNRLKVSMGLESYREFFRLGSFFEEAIYILDCCRDFKAAATDGPQIDQIQPWSFRPTREAVIMAAPWGDKAFEFSPENEDRRGILTDALLEGLKGAFGAYDPRGLVTMNTLKAFLEKQVPLKTNVANLQRPPEAEGHDIVLATVPQANLATTRVKIVAPAGLNGTLEVLRGDNTVVDRRAASEARDNGVTWEVVLLRGFVHQVRHVESKISAQLDLSDTTVAQTTFPFPRLQ